MGLKYFFCFNMKKLFLCFFLLFGIENAVLSQTDSITTTDSITSAIAIQPRKSFLQKLRKTVRAFSYIDTNYIEPQAYNFTVMLQNTNTFEVYNLRNKTGQEFSFSPKPAYKLGPYVGWRWVFLGYTFDLTHLFDSNLRQDFNLSFYTSQIGLDLFYRKSGNDYRISRIKLGSNYNTDAMNGVSFNGFTYNMKGFNIYYIFNHQKFSYPAAYSQSTIQRRSCGSALAGIGYTKHKIKVNWARLNRLVEERLGTSPSHPIIDSTMVLGNIEYSDYSISGGYAYNWVFAYNWLFDASLQGAVGYKHSKSDLTNKNNERSQVFNLGNFNIDGIVRLGIVWNNMRWYAGSNIVFHGYNYHKEQFSTNNLFGSVNFYVGYNFNRRH